jgi:hypothetical protein
MKILKVLRKVALAPLKDTIKASDVYTALHSTLRMCELKINTMSA